MENGSARGHSKEDGFILLGLLGGTHDGPFVSQVDSGGGRCVSHTQSGPFLGAFLAPGLKEAHEANL